MQVCIFIHRRGVGGIFEGGRNRCHNFICILISICKYTFLPAHISICIRTACTFLAIVLTTVLYAYQFLHLKFSVASYYSVNTFYIQKDSHRRIRIEGFAYQLIKLSHINKFGHPKFLFAWFYNVKTWKYSVAESTCSEINFATMDGWSSNFTRIEICNKPVHIMVRNSVYASKSTSDEIKIRFLNKYP